MGNEGLPRTPEGSAGYPQLTVNLWVKGHWRDQGNKTSLWWGNGMPIACNFNKSR